MTNLLQDVPRYWRWLSYAVVVAIVVTVLTSILQILAGIFG
jgi:hypothetical protein